MLGLETVPFIKWPSVPRARVVQGADGAKVFVGKKGNPINVVKGTNVPAVINGRKFTGHALDRIQGNGFAPMIIEDAIKIPPRSYQAIRPVQRYISVKH